MSLDERRQRIISEARGRKLLELERIHYGNIDYIPVDDPPRFLSELCKHLEYIARWKIISNEELLAKMLSFIELARHLSDAETVKRGLGLIGEILQELRK